MDMAALSSVFNALLPATLPAPSVHHRHALFHPPRQRWAWHSSPLPATRIAVDTDPFMAPQKETYLSSSFLLPSAGADVLVWTFFNTLLVRLHNGTHYVRWTATAGSTVPLRASSRGYMPRRTRTAAPPKHAPLFAPLAYRTTPRVLRARCRVHAYTYSGIVAAFGPDAISAPFPVKARADGRHWRVRRDVNAYGVPHPTSWTNSFIVWLHTRTPRAAALPHTVWMRCAHVCCCARCRT